MSKPHGPTLRQIERLAESLSAVGISIRFDLDHEHLGGFQDLTAEQVARCMLGPEDVIAEKLNFTVASINWFVGEYGCCLGTRADGKPCTQPPRNRVQWIGQFDPGNPECWLCARHASQDVPSPMVRLRPRGGEDAA